MSETSEHSDSGAPAAPAERGFFDPRAWVAELPYVAMLAAAFIGVAVSNASGHPTTLYWEFLVPIYAVICVLSGRVHGEENAKFMRLIWTQALHWLACVVTMWLLFLPQVRGSSGDNGTSLGLLAVLALSTFLAGLHAGTWRIALVGILIGLLVPIMAWLVQSSLLLLLLAVVLIVVAIVFIWLRTRATPETETA
jgi:hypothetical protein